MIPIGIYASSPFNAFTGIKGAPAPQWCEWMMTRPEMIIGWSPWQDVNVGAYKQMLCYMDTYAIPNNNPPQPTDIAVTHPEWILHDNNGNKLFIPYNCANGSCQAYAGDLTNPAFVANQMATLQAIVTAGYQGVFLDNANLGIKVGDGTGAIVMPSGFTNEIWSRAMANFLSEVRASFPKLVIVHNSVWFDGAADVWVNQAIVACTYYNMQRGYGDPNLSDLAKGQQLKFVDRIHTYGRSVIQMEDSQNPVSPSTMTLQEKINWFQLGYKPGDLMIVADAFPNAWPALLDSMNPA